MSTEEFPVPTSDRSSMTEFEKFAHGLAAEESDITRSHAHRAFYAGWNARFNAALQVFAGSSDDKLDDLSIIQNHLRILTDALRAAQDKYFDIYSGYLREKRINARLRAALQVKSNQSGEEQAWVRVSNQRKELKALGQHSARQAVTIQGYFEKSQEDAETIETLRNRIIRLEAERR